MRPRIPATLEPTAGKPLAAAHGVERSRYAGGFAEIDDPGDLVRTLRFNDKFLLHPFIDLISRSIDVPDHCFGSRSHQFHGSNETYRNWPRQSFNPTSSGHGMNQSDARLARFIPLWA